VFATRGGGHGILLFDQCTAKYRAFQEGCYAFVRRRRGAFAADPWAIAADSIFIGEVQYLNYAEDHIPLGNSFYPVICKRREFKYENEVRAVIWRLPLSHDKQSIDMSKDLIGRGIPVQVDLHALIEKIYISPYAADYIFDVVSDSVEKYGLSINVCRSQV
jgi:hypothetical protein